MPRICYKRKRMSRERMSLIESALEIMREYDTQGYSLTLRQLYYQFVSRDLLPNTVKSYKLLGDVISDGRMAGYIDWDAINDRLRESRTVACWEKPNDILMACAKQFKLDLWKNQPYRVEVWVEKDALAEVICRAAHALRCPVMVCRGYMSQSAMWEAGQRFKQYIKNDIVPKVFHLGDHDPSGIDMTRDIEDRLCTFAEGFVSVERIALNMDQVDKYNPPPNPAKITDTRAGKYIREFGGTSWELDALEPRMLAGLIKEKISDLIVDEIWEETLGDEMEHRRKLTAIAEKYK